MRRLIYIVLIVVGLASSSYASWDAFGSMAPVVQKDYELSKKVALENGSSVGLRAAYARPFLFFYVFFNNFSAAINHEKDALKIEAKDTKSILAVLEMYHSVMQDFVQVLESEGDNVENVFELKAEDFDFYGEKERFGGLFSSLEGSVKRYLWPGSSAGKFYTGLNSVTPVTLDDWVGDMHDMFARDDLRSLFLRKNPAESLPNVPKRDVLITTWADYKALVAEQPWVCLQIAYFLLPQPAPPSKETVEDAAISLLSEGKQALIAQQEAAGTALQESADHRYKPEADVYLQKAFEAFGLLCTETASLMAQLRHFTPVGAQLQNGSGQAIDEKLLFNHIAKLVFEELTEELMSYTTHEIYTNARTMLADLCFDVLINEAAASEEAKLKHGFVKDYLGRLLKGGLDTWKHEDVLGLMVILDRVSLEEGFHWIGRQYTNEIVVVQLLEKFAKPSLGNSPTATK